VYEVPPIKMMLLQALLPQTKSIPVPVQNLHNIFLAVAKYKQMAGECRQVKVVLNHYR